MILGVIQGRMSSTRLPGKVLATVEGMPMIGRQIERLRRSQRLDDLVLATSADPSDDPLANYAASLNLPVIRGPLHDVLARFSLVLDAFPQASTLVRLTADCPLTDWRVLDALVDLHAAAGADYTSNVMPDRTFPHGLDIEVVRVQALSLAVAEATDPYDLEHVTPFLYRHPERFKIENLTRSPSLALLRWTVDYPQDLNFVRHVYRTLLHHDPDFGTDAIVALNPNSAPEPV